MDEKSLSSKRMGDEMKMDEKLFVRISRLLLSFYITWMKTTLIEYPLYCYILFFGFFYLKG